MTTMKVKKKYLNFLLIMVIATFSLIVLDNSVQFSVVDESTNEVVKEKIEPINIQSLDSGHECNKDHSAPGFKCPKAGLPSGADPKNYELIDKCIQCPNLIDNKGECPGKFNPKL